LRTGCSEYLDSKGWNEERVERVLNEEFNDVYFTQNIVRVII
jgi:hypothetical protein